MFTFISFVLTIAGCLNWLMIGILQYDFIAGIFGFQASIFSRLIYVVFGFGGIYLLIRAIVNKGTFKVFERKKKKKQEEEQPKVAQARLIDENAIPNETLESQNEKNMVENMDSKFEIKQSREESVSPNSNIDETDSSAHKDETVENKQIEKENSPQIELHFERLQEFRNKKTQTENKEEKDSLSNENNDEKSGENTKKYYLRQNDVDMTENEKMSFEMRDFFAETNKKEQEIDSLFDEHLNNKK